jgi:hypothetical protein
MITDKDRERFNGGDILFLNVITDDGLYQLTVRSEEQLEKFIKENLDFVYEKIGWIAHERFMRNPFEVLIEPVEPLDEIVE